MFDSNLVQNVFFYQTGGSTFCWALWIIINEVVFQRSKSKYILGKRTSSGAGPSLEEERSILQGGCLVQELVHPLKRKGAFCKEVVSG
jgi:hypothetical protein